MKKLFKALGIKKSDEMEKSIQLKSIRLAWVFTVVFLFTWSLYEIYIARMNYEPINFLPLILLFSQNIILFFSQLFYRFRMTKDGDEEEKESLLKKILPFVVVIIIAAAIAFIMTRSMMG